MGLFILNYLSLEYFRLGDRLEFVKVVLGCRCLLSNVLGMIVHFYLFIGSFWNLEDTFFSYIEEIIVIVGAGSWNASSFIHLRSFFKYCNPLPGMEFIFESMSV